MFGKTKKHQMKPRFCPKNHVLTIDLKDLLPKSSLGAFNAFFQWLPKWIYSVISVLLVQKYHLLMLYFVSDISTPIIWK